MARQIYKIYHLGRRSDVVAEETSLAAAQVRAHQLHRSTGHVYAVREGNGAPVYSIGKAGAFGGEEAHEIAQTHTDRALSIGDRVRVRNQARADEYGFQGALEGRIVRFGMNDGEPDALLDDETMDPADVARGGALGRWMVLRHLEKVG